MSERRLAAIMFTDMVGYTALMGRDTARALELVRISKEIQKPLVEKNNGKWLKEIGDGALAQFHTALDAVNCAVEIQVSARAELDAKLRIGIHLGDITVENDDVYGDGVNVAARLESIADPGGIYISESIEKAIRGQSSAPAKYLGEINLKNVDYGVRTYAIQGEGLPIPEAKDEKDISGHFWAEVQRRGMVRAGTAYLVFSLFSVLLLPYAQAATNLPQWTTIAFVITLLAGFPVALILAWKYERSPEGIVKTTSRESWQNPYKVSQRKPLTSSVIIAGLALIILFMYFYPRLYTADRRLQSDDASFDVAELDKSIAVLPFTNLSNDPDQEYFSVGMMEEILNHLCKIEDLRVPSSATSMKYTGASLSATEIATEIGVSHILMGSIRKNEDQLRITVQLIDAVHDKHLWARSYDGLLTDTIFVIQSNIARKIASSLRAVITPEEEQSIDRVPTSDIAAYDAYIRAEYERWTYLRTTDDKHLKTAHSLFEKALQIDPDYLLAVVGMGQIYNLENKTDSAFIYADRALDLDPNFNRAYGLKGYCYQIKGEHDLAMEHFFKAISLPPEDDWWSWYHIAIGWQYFGVQNDIIKALPYYKKGTEMKGSQYLSFSVFALGDVYIDVGDYDKAEQYMRESFDLEESCWAIYENSRLLRLQGKFEKAFRFAEENCREDECKLSCSLAFFEASILLNKFEEAEQYFYQYQALDPFEHQGYTKNRLSPDIGLVYYKLGKTVEANRYFNDEILRLKTHLDQGPTELERYFSKTHLNLAKIYAFRNDREQALKYLAEYARLGFTRGYHDFILIDPFFQNLRDDPEFKAIVKEAQTEKAALRAQIREMEERGELDL